MEKVFTCDNCEFWDREKVPDGFRNKIEEYCMCMMAVMSWSDKKTPMLVEDASLYDATLFTHKDHGCNCFKEKEK